MPFRESHLYIMLVNRAVGGGLEVLKGLTTYSVHITKQEQRLSFPPDAYHVDKRSGCKEVLQSNLGRCSSTCYSEEVAAEQRLAWIIRSGVHW